MKFLISATSAFVMASTLVSASPIDAMYARGGGARTRRPRPMIPTNNTTTSSADIFESTQQSNNWGGAAIVTTNVTQATGTFTIPTPKVPTGGSSSTQYCGAAWVGIDGDTCQTGLIQSGVLWCIQNGQIGFEAWYEYLPQASVAYSGISLAAGNQISVTIIKTSSTSGTTKLTNISTGQTVTHTFTSQSSGTLCGNNAEWIVEDFSSGSSVVPFANFGNVTFTNANAVIAGKTVTPGSAGANNIQLTLNNQQTTSTTISGSTVAIQYV